MSTASGSRKDTANPVAPEGSTRLSNRELALATACVMMAYFLAILGQTTIGAAMPSIVADLGGFDRYTWASISYLVISAIVTPIAGGLSDLYGRRAFFLIGIALFVISSIPASLSQSMIQLTGFTGIQGAGAGCVIAASFVAIADLFPPEERGKYQGLLGLVFGMAAVAGLILGGLISDHLTWRWIFFLNILFGFPVLLLLARYFPRIKPEAERSELDYPGMAVLALAIVPLLVALSWAGVQYKWSSWQVIGPLAFGLAMIPLFIVIESKAVSPIMPLEIYRNRAVVVSVIVSFFAGFGIFAILLFGSLLFQTVQDVSATSSGGLLALMVFGFILGSMVAGQMLSRADARYRLQTLAGTGILTAGMFLFSTINENTSFGEAAGCNLLVGFGFGATLTIVTVVVQNSTPYRLVGISTSALQFFRTVSGTVGVAVLGVLLRERFASNLDESLSADVRSSLLPSQIEAIRKNPQNYVATDATATAEFAETTSHAPQLADTLQHSINAALASSISYLFFICGVLLVLSMLASLFLRTQRDESE